MRLRDALSGPGLAAIAEFKRRSPSLGDIRPDARVEEIVPAYANAGASAISVLVDERFAGTIDDLRAARAVTDVPLLAKGFFSTEEHLRELREAGADAALLILRDLDDATTAQLMRYAESIGLDTLVEAHDDEELDRAHRLEADRAYVVHGFGGIDELSPCGPNLVCEVENGRVREYELDPLELGIERCDPSELRGGDPRSNAAALRAVLAGADGGHRSAVVLNAAGGIAAAGHAEDLREGIMRAKEAIDSGAAAARLDELVEFSHAA